jgi:hypothetical protein
MAANTTLGADVIRLPSGVYDLAIANQGSDETYEGAFEGDLDIAQDVTIRNVGPGATAIVDANGAQTGDRAFEIWRDVIHGDVPIEVTFRGIGVRDGRAPVDGTGEERGGAIRVNGGATLTMRDGSVRSSFAEDQGGGIFVNQGTLRLTRVVVAGNEVGFGFGGAIHQTLGVVDITDSVLRGNHADGFGGALSGNGLAHVIRSLLVRNSTDNFGGALYAFGCGSYSFLDSTITGNTALGAGAIRSRNATIAAVYSTVTENEATGPGGGIAVLDDDGDGCPAEAYLRGSILAGNRDNVGSGPPAVRDCANEDLDPLVHSQGYNLVGDGTECDLVPGTGDQIGTYGAPIDPGLAPLGFNGGAMRSLLTHRLLSTSPARDAGAPGAGCAIGLETDQRGVPRGLGGRCDKGAYERVTCRGIVVNRVGTAGRDVASDPAMRPTSGSDGILGLGGNDSLAGSGGGDGLCGGAGRDALSGDGGNDRLAGGADRDVCKGGPGQDTQTGCEVTSGIP